MVDQSIQKSIVNFSNGNGFIVTQDGVIFTCFHVIKDNPDYNKILCSIGGKEYNAKIIDKWENLDFAVLQLLQEKSQPKEFESIPIGLEPPDIDPTKHYETFYYDNNDNFAIEHGKNLNPYYSSPEEGLNYLKFESDVISGMSGSPFWDFQSKKVIGVVIEQDPKEYHHVKSRQAEPIKTKIFCIAVSMSSIINSIMKSEIESEIEKFSPSLMNIIKQIKEGGIPEVPTELKLCLEVKRNPDFVRVNEVYRNPKGFEDALEKLKSTKFIIITGPPNIGKTATAHKLANTIKQANKKINLIFSIRDKKIEYLSKLENSIIIFDDIFGEVKFTDVVQANQFREYQNLTNKNYLIYTTREEILLEVKSSRTKFSEFPDLDDNIFRIEPDSSYDDNDLRQILENHLNYYFKQDYISKNEIEIAENNKFEIIEKLRFPHNYKELVEIELSKVSNNQITIEKAIENAKHIKRAVKLWFTNMEDKSIKFFIFTLGLFQNLHLNEKKFYEIYLEVIELLKKRHSDLNVFGIKTLLKNPLISIYIRKKGDFIDFIHPQYLEGVYEGIIKDCVEDINTIQPLLKEIIVDENVDIRRAITYTLGEIGKVTAELVIPLLKEMMKDEEFDVRRSVGEVLGEIGKKEPELVIPLLKEMMKDEISGIRGSVAEALGKIGISKPELVIPLLKEMIKDDGMGVRRSLAEALGKTGISKPELVIPLLKEVMKDDGLGVRASVVNALGEIGKKGPELVIPLLKDLIRDEDFSIRWFVGAVLGEIGKEEPELVIPLLKEKMKDEHYRVRVSVAEALGKIGTSKPELVIPLLKEMMNDEHFWVRGSVAKALGYTGTSKPELVIPLLKEMMEVGGLGVRGSIAEALGKTGISKPELVIPLLKEMMKDETSGVRWSVVGALGKISKIEPKLVIPVLKEMTKDGHSGVRVDVAEVLGEIGKIDSELVIPLLKEMMKDEEFEVRRSVVEALGKTGTIKPELVIPLLKEMMNDEDSLV